MKVFLFAIGDLDEGNGASSRFRCYHKALANQGINLSAYLFLPTDFGSTGINKRSSGCIDGLAFKYLTGRPSRHQSGLARILELPKAWIQAVRLLLKNRNSLDTLFIYGGNVLVFGPAIIAAKVLSIPIVMEYTELQSSAEYQGRIRLSTRLLRLVDRINERFAHLLCSHLVVISTRLREHYSKLFRPDRLSLVPILVDHSRFTALPESKPGLIGYLGSFGYKDGVSGILEAFQKAKQVNPSLRLRLMGYASDYDRIAEVISPSVTSGIEYTGQVSYDDIPGLLAECSLLIMNRIDIHFSNFGFPTKLGEYLATGVPVVATDVSDVSHYLKHNEEAIIIPPDDSDALSTAMLAHAVNSNLSSQIGKKGRVVSEKYFGLAANAAVLKEALSKKK